MITAATARVGLFEPTLDGRALNLEQQALLVNATPEVDCLADVLLPLVKVAPKETADALGYLRLILERNRAEGEQWNALAQTTDALAKDLRRVELNDPAARTAMTGREILQQVGGPLNVLDRVPDMALVVDAVRQVDAVIDQAPRMQIFSRKVRRELGARRLRLLRQMVQSRTRETGAGTSGLAANGEASRDALAS